MFEKKNSNIKKIPTKKNRIMSSPIEPRYFRNMWTQQLALSDIGPVNTQISACIIMDEFCKLYAEIRTQRIYKLVCADNTYNEYCVNNPTKPFYNTKACFPNTQCTPNNVCEFVVDAFYAIDEFWKNMRNLTDLIKQQLGSRYFLPSLSEIRLPVELLPGGNGCTENNVQNLAQKALDTLKYLGSTVDYYLEMWDKLLPT